VIILTPGNVADCTVGPECVDMIAGVKTVIGDKAYDSDAFRKSLQRDGIKPVIPGRANRKRRIRHDKEAYKRRNVIERCILHLPAQGFQAYRHALRQTRQKFLFRDLFCRRRGPTGYDLIES